ncbi:hypothetical protein [Pseudomonas sp. S5D5]|uniref:hypothetical protein n=1 Tax=Pseudomonas sp. S5D5 TaxID=2083056 RepID=UPI000D0F57AF|nr:hypothetical protein [Pseudomonas sp. S5D5]
MYVIFYCLSSFPALALSFGLGNVPVRYLALPTLLYFSEFRKVDVLFLVAALFHLLYSLASAGVRPFSLLDFSYALAYIYILLGVAVVRKNPEYFKIFVIVFWLLNIIYAVYQDTFLMLDGNQFWVMMHENTHDVSYVLPKVEFIPYLYRVTGLFVESAPFVIYLMMTHLAFSILLVSKWLKYINMLFIFLAGAKIGYVFLLLVGASFVVSKLGLKILKFMVLGILLVFSFAPFLLGLLYGARAFESLWVRLNSFYEIVQGFSSETLGFLFGYGMVSSTQLMSGDFEGPMRGIDFFSTYIYANGVLGSLALLLPLVLWAAFNVNALTLLQKNLSSLIIFLSLLTMGSLINFQYAYYFFILAFSSCRTVGKSVSFRENN